MGSRATCVPSGVTLYGPDLAMFALEELSFCGLITSLLISLSEFEAKRVVVFGIPQYGLLP